MDVPRDPKVRLIEIMLTLGGLLGVIYATVNPGTTMVVIMYPFCFVLFASLGLLTYVELVFRKSGGVWYQALWGAFVFCFVVVLGLTFFVPILDVSFYLFVRFTTKVALDPTQKVALAVFGMELAYWVTYLLGWRIKLWRGAWELNSRLADPEPPEWETLGEE